MKVFRPAFGCVEHPKAELVKIHNSLDLLCVNNNTHFCIPQFVPRSEYHVCNSDPQCAIFRWWNWWVPEWGYRGRHLHLIWINSPRFTNVGRQKKTFPQCVQVFLSHLCVTSFINDVTQIYVFFFYSPFMSNTCALYPCVTWLYSSSYPNILSFMSPVSS